MDFTEQDKVLLKSRYYKGGEDWSGFCCRVAKAYANDDKEYSKFYQVLLDRDFLPNTPALVNAGKDIVQPSACFYLPIEDSIEGIFKTLSNTAFLFKSGGGVGINFSSLRPEGSSVQSTKGVASGPVSFMKIFDEMTQQLKQGGVRRGAMIAILNIDHPDIVKFITCKDDVTELTNMNISIAVTDEFMKKLPSSDFVTCKYNDDVYYIINDGVPVVSGMSGDLDEDVKMWTYKDLWDLLVKQAWKNGEPGIVFIDTIHKKNGYDIEGVNPCGESILAPYEACVLGSINLSNFYSSLSNSVSYSRLRDVIEIGVIFLNRTIDKATYPISEISDAVRKTRKIGLGVMGWADLLIKLGIKYGSDESLILAEKLGEFLTDTSISISEDYGFQNNEVTSIAPTGSLSIISGCSSGIEPNIGWEVIHNRKDFGKNIVRHPLTIDFDLDNLPEYFVTSSDVTFDQHVNMQAAWQANISQSISKTINMLKEATVDDVDKAFRLAYSKGCKGITVYRDGSRPQQVLSRKDRKIIKPERPYKLNGSTFKVSLEINGEVETSYISVNYHPYNRIYEIFLQGNVRGLNPKFVCYIDTITRLISLALRCGVDVNDIVDQLEKVQGTYMYSIPIKLAQILKEANCSEEMCPNCGNSVIHNEGCIKCVCGWGKCG